MTDNSVVQAIKDAEIDARSLSEFIYKPADFMVARRLAPPINTLQYYLDYLNLTVPQLVKDALLKIGFELLDSFTLGATLTERNQALKSSDGKYYRWDGTLPKTVPSGSTPASTGGTGKGKWMEVSDAVFRNDILKTTGAGLVGLDTSLSYPAGTVGNKLQIKRVLYQPFIPTISSPADNGQYLVAYAPDMPFDGVANVQIYPLGGGTHNVGFCEITSSTLNPPRKAIATIKDGVWSQFFESPTVNIYGEVVKNSSNIKSIGRGSYSWWNEPQSIAIDGIYPSTIIGAVESSFRDGSGAVKAIEVDNATQDNDARFVTLKTESQYIPDEHNAPSTIQTSRGLVVFNPSHNDSGVNYLPYYVSPDTNMRNLGTEKRIITSHPVSYSQLIFNNKTDELYVAFRSAGGFGHAHHWFIARSTDWDAETPTWTIKEMFANSNQAYMRWKLDANGGMLRCVLTKNASVEATNAFWYAYISLPTWDVKTVNGTTVGNVETATTNVDTLGTILTSARRIRLYDFTVADLKLHILYNEFDDDVAGGDYRYLSYTFSNFRVAVNTPIVASGSSLGSNYYFGGASFKQTTHQNVTSNSPIYLAREEAGTWYVEEWTATSGSGMEWQKTRVIDSSKTAKLWRPRAPYNVDLITKPNQVRLTWCKGDWRGYSTYQSAVWALIE